MAKFVEAAEELGGTLAMAYGPHVVSGHVVEKVTEGAGDSAQTTLIVLLGEGVWNRIVHAYYGGAEIPDTDYHFHNGYLSDSMATATFGLNALTGMNEWTQGVDPWNVGGQTYSGTAYVIIKLPIGVTGDDDFGKLKFICECLRVANYNSSGVQLDKDGATRGTAGSAPDPQYFFYSTNPARAIADLMLVRRKIAKSRINWTAWNAWRVFNDVTITWTGGNAPARPTYQTVENMIEGSDGAAIKAYGVANQWDAGVFSASAITSGVNGFFEADIGEGHILIGLTPNTSVTTGTGAADFQLALHFRIDGNVDLYESGIIQGTISNWVTGDRFRVAVDGGVFVVSKYGVVIDTSSFGLGAPSYPLYGAVEGFTIGSEILRSTISPAGAISAERTRKRFECGLAFPNQTDIAIAMEAVLYISCAEMQDGETITFLPPTMAGAVRTDVFSFDSSNIMPGSFKTYRLAREQKPTKMTGRYRDIDSPTLKEETVPVDRDALVTLLGRENPAPEVYLGSITRGQAECILNYYMRKMTDLDLYCQFQAKGTSWKVLPGDAVLITEESAEWIDVKFEVIESTDESSIDTPDFRTFTCQIFNDETYSDTDQTPLIANVIVRRLDILSPSPFIGLFDSINGDILFDWASRTPFDNPALESYTVQVTDSSGNLIRNQNIYPYLNTPLEEYVVWDENSYTPHTAPYDDFTLETNGGMAMPHSVSIYSKALADVVGGLLVQWRIPTPEWVGGGLPGWYMAHRVSIVPEGTAVASATIFWDFVGDWLGGYAYPEGTFIGDPYKRKVLQGDYIGIFIRPDGVVEYHVNYTPSATPLYISGVPVDPTVGYRAGVFGTGGIQTSFWRRQGPEWKYGAEAQKFDNSGSLPSVIYARVRQNNPSILGEPSDWTYGVFTR